MVFLVAATVVSCSDGSDPSDLLRPTTTVAPATSSAGDDVETTGEGEDEASILLEDVTAPEWQPETRTDELAMEVATSERLTVQHAVDAYALLDPSMPGATPTDLPPGDGLDATHTLALIEQFRDQLAPEQLEVVPEPSAEDVVGAVEPDGAITEGPPPEGEPPRGLRAPAPGLLRQPSETVQARYLRLLGQVGNDWNAYKPGLLPTQRYELALSRSPIPGRGMTAQMVSAGTCRISVDPGLWRGTRTQTDDSVVFYFAHELFHCVQFSWDPYLRAPGWVIEGGADFAATDLYRSVFSPDLEYAHDEWFRQGYVPLAARKYDAWVIYEQVLATGADPYQVMRAQIPAPGGSTDALLEAGGMDRLLFRMAWASRSLRSTLHDQTWRFPWPGPQSGLGPHDNLVQAGTRGLGRFQVKVLGRYTHPQLGVRIESAVGILDVTAHGGPLTTVTAEGNVTVADGTSERFCFAPEGCRCPSGETANAIQMNDRLMIFSFPPTRDGAHAEAIGRKWDPRRHCEKERDRRAASYGDPHIHTLDGLPVNVMTLGEFVNARDPEGGFELQTRHVDGGLPGAASTSAVAVGTGDHRVTFTSATLGDPNGIVVRVDGNEAPADDLSAGDVRVERRAENEFTAAWPDGTTVNLEWHRGWFVELIVPSERAARLEGLMGSADGDLRNDLRMPDGAIVDESAAEGTEAPYALAWAVDEETTLFDYEPGESPATFRIPHPNPDGPPVDEEALRRCEESLGERAARWEIEFCAFDVATTGEEDYVEAYTAAVESRLEFEGAGGSTVVVDEGSEPPVAGGGSAAEGEPTLVLSGTVAAPFSSSVGGDVAGRLEGSFEAEPGTVVMARAELCLAEATVTLTVEAVESGLSTFVFLCDPAGIQAALADDDDDEVVRGEAYVWLPEGGPHRVTLETDQEDPAFLEVEVFADPSPTIIAADEVARAGEITLEGAGDTAVFEMGLDDRRWSASGMDTACAVVAYGAPELGDGAPWGLNLCTHESAEIAVGNAGVAIPLVVFTRTDEPATVSLEPEG